MRFLACLCLAALIVATSLAPAAQAGRRRVRRAAVITGVAAGTAVAATRRRPVAVVGGAAPVIVARPVVQPAPVLVRLLPDLIVDEMRFERGVHRTTVKNIGQIASPATQMHVEFRRAADNTLLGAVTVQVPRLAPRQSIPFNLHALPPGRLQATALVDPENRVAEISEQNNLLIELIEFLPPTVSDSSLPEVDVDVEPIPEEPVAVD